MSSSSNHDVMIISLPNDNYGVVNLISISLKLFIECPGRDLWLKLSQNCDCQNPEIGKK